MVDFLLLEGGTDKLLLQGTSDRLLLDSYIDNVIDFEALTEGQTIGNGSTALGSLWSVSASTTATALAAAKAQGGMGLRVTGTGGFWQGTFTETTHGQQRVLSGYFSPTTTGTITYMAAVIDGGSNVGNWRINANGSVSLRNLVTVPSGGGPSTYLLDLSGATRYRFEWTILSGTAGQQLNIFLGDDENPLFTLTGIMTTATRSGFYFGIGATAAGSSIDYDTIRVTESAPGPYVPGAPPAPPAGVFLDPLSINVLGDSLTWMRSNGPTNIGNALASRGWDFNKAQVSGVTGRLIWGGSTHPDTSESIATWRTASPNAEASVWLLALGANNQGASMANLISYYTSLLTLIGPGRFVRFIDQGFGNVEVNKWAYNSSLGVGARYTKVTGSGLTATQCSNVNAALRNMMDIANADPTTYPSVKVYDWNNDSAMRTAGAGLWDPTDTSALDGSARHMTDAAYLAYRAPFYAYVVAQDFEVNNGAMFATI